MFHGQKKLRDQVIVITGATSGIGLATARAAAKRKARLVLAARNGDDLARVRRELEEHSPGVAFVETDVAKKADIEALAAMAMTSFGGFDTWVNNAGQSIFGRLDEVSDEDHERLFQVNFWGTVQGSLIAAQHFKTHGGGTIVNVGSIAGDFAIPLQGMYSASKHAIRGFTDAFRMELEAEDAPINLTLVKPAAIDSPLPGRSRNYMAGEPTLPAGLPAARGGPGDPLGCHRGPPRHLRRRGRTHAECGGASFATLVRCHRCTGDDGFLQAERGAAEPCRSPSYRRRRSCRTWRHWRLHPAVQRLHAAHPESVRPSRDAAGPHAPAGEDEVSLGFHGVHGLVAEDLLLVDHADQH